MRLIAIFVTLAALAGAGLAGQKLYQALQAPPAPPVLAEVPQAPAAEPQPPTTAAPPSRAWPPLFGELAPPAPPPAPEPQPPAPEPEPQPPVPPMPPVDSLGYALKGVVRQDEAVWAIVSHPTGELLLQEGEMLNDELLVARIDDQGLWLRRKAYNEDPVLLGFAE